MQPLSGNQRLDLRTSLMNMSLVLRLPRKMHLCRSSSNVPRLPSFFEMLQNPHVLLTFDKVHNPVRLPRDTTSERPKVVRTPGVFHILISKCASHHNGVHFFNISTSKSGPEMVCFVHFDFEMCFAPQRRALFPSKSGAYMWCFVDFDFEICFAPQRRALFRHLIMNIPRTSHHRKRKRQSLPAPCAAPATRCAVALLQPGACCLDMIICSMLLVVRTCRLSIRP